MNQKCIVLCFFLLFLSACASRQVNLDNIDTTNLSQLEEIKATPTLSTKTEISILKIKSLEDIAMSLGAQGGLAWTSMQINTNLEKDRKYLDTIFNFSGMMLSHGVIPPVLVEGDNSLNLADPNTIRVADKSYKIVQQAQFVTTPPNWREYLLMSYSKPQLPDKTLLPKTKEEQKVWKKSVKMGWDKGLQQGLSIFQQNLARLKRDYRGMITYRKLLQEKMISPPFVSRTELGITGNGNDMRINDQVLRIVELPKLQTSGKHWRAVVVKEHE
ncbi:MAG: hypothetical protein A3F12_06230 [Gammaproteobacteria bacterium RIFCSPHIGHO2_12_FULL_38_14]|nr:MAG: hypothetical protein A3F12_06230 [Gammaproteobacteria bacterium RIFCSPHIGHO2_12_FULL_38_14]